MFYARTYRHLKPRRRSQVLYLLLFVTPCFVLLLFCYSPLTRLISEWAARFLQHALGSAAPPSIGQHEFIPWFGPVHYVMRDSIVPSQSFVIGVLIAALIAAAMLGAGPFRGKPLSIFGLFAITVQIISCVFFLVGPLAFPYGVTDYSLLYMEQQVGIWLCFTVIAGVTTGLISYGKVQYKALTFAVIMAYSLVFGTVRYLTYLLVVSALSPLFMAVLFFALGPFFDFLYLVFFYSLFVDRLNASFGRRERGEVWLWA